ncbi:hypothetical protein D3C76_911720 [compost metagenome]
MQGIVRHPAAHVVGVTEVTVPRVDVHLVAVRVFLQQRLLPVGQVLGVLVHVLRSDHQNRLFIGIRVHRLVTGELDVVPARHLAQVLAGVRRDGARRIAGLLGTDAGQVLAKPGGFFRRHGGVGTGDQARVEGQSGCEYHTCCCFHVLPPSLIRLVVWLHCSGSSRHGIVRRD